jgi:site-specific recombinase XerC
MAVKRDSRGLFISQSKSYEPLLLFESMKYWDMALVTPKTKDVYFRTMGKFLEWVDLPEISSPDDLLELSDSGAVDLIRKFSHKYEVEGKRKMSQMVKTVLKSFYSANNRQLTSPHLKVHKVPKTKRTYNRIVPTKKEVYLMADAATSLRNKAVVLALWQSGLRNNTFNNLTIGHVKEALLKREVPLKIDITPDIDKQNLREQYYTFIDYDAIEAIRRHLRTRGDISTINEEEPLFLSNLDGEKKALSDAAVRRAVKNSARNAGLNPDRIWPHCLRSSFYNMLVEKVDDVEREFLFGHAMGVRSHYFAPQWVEKLRSSYSNVGWGRSSLTMTKEEVRTEVIGALMGKISDAELAPIAGKLGISPQQIRTMIRRIRADGSEEETEALLETERNNGNCNNNHCESKLIPEGELCQHIDSGWDLVKELSNGKLLVKRAS